MGFWDLFKKTPPAQPAVKPAPAPAVQPAPAPVVQPAPAPVVQPAPAPAVQPAPAPVVQPAPAPVVQPAPAPAVKPVPAPVAQPAPAPVVQPAPAPVVQPAPAAQSVNRPAPRPAEIRWPSNGTNGGWLASSQAFFVYADARFMRSAGAEKFVEAWRGEKQRRNLKRTWFVPQFELDALSEEERKTVEQWNDTYSVRTAQKNYAELFQAISRMSWKIVFLTAPGDDNAVIRRAAADAKIDLRLYAVAESGKISPIFIPSNRPAQNTPAPKEPVSAAPVNAFDTPMTLTKPRRAERIPVRIPTTSSVVLDDQGKRILLGKPVMSNTTSITYATDDPALYAKVFTAPLLGTTMPEQKCRLMLSRRIDIPGVCWPRSALTDENGVFVGVLTDKAEGIQLHEALLRESTVRHHFSDWSRQDLATLALTILKMIRSLQNWHVYFGCLNLSAILVKDKNTVYFVDMDGWQIEGYPVLFDNKLFVPPELQNRDTRLHFYNQDELNYQIAYLMFMLMMPGRLPYSSRHGSTLTESIVNQEFAFGMGDGMRSTIKQDSSAGFWRFVWDHISYNLGKNFYQTFARGGSFSSEGARLHINKWIDDMTEYAQSLNNPFDPESRKMYPSTFRRAKNRIFKKCDFCGTEHPEFYLQRDMSVQVNRRRERIQLDSVLGGKNICKTCWHERSDKFFPGDPKTRFVCEGCGDTFYYTNAARFMHEYMEAHYGWMPQKWCPNCKEPFEEKICVDCGCRFTVSVGQYKSFTRKGYSLPKRCNECQRKKTRF